MEKWTQDLLHINRLIFLWLSIITFTIMKLNIISPLEEAKSILIN